MPIDIDYAACASSIQEDQEMQLVDYEENDSKDYRKFSDSKLEDEILKFQRLTKQDLRLPDNKNKLFVHLHLLESEKAQRDKAKQLFEQKGAGTQIHEKRSLIDSIENTSAKERRVDPLAFVEEIKFHRFPLGIGRKRDFPAELNDSKSSPTEINPGRFYEKPMTPILRAEQPSTTSTRNPSKSPVCKSQDMVVLFSSDDETTDKCGILNSAKATLRRTSSRIAERRKVDLNHKIAYPSRDDPDAVEVYYRDLHHLRPMEFLNDTVIDFYIKYLQRPEGLDHERKEQFHFFNSFFYKKLTEAFDCKDEQKRKEAFSKLRKWTKGTNILDKSYLILPINNRLHWSLAIVAFSQSGGGLMPYIFHLDSLENGHASLEIFKCLRKYLNSEHKLMENATEIKWNQIIKERVEVPRQENEYDCGLFLLYYIQRFVETAPLPCKLTNTENLFGRKWFRPRDASQLRSKVKDILEHLFEDVAAE